MVNAPAEDQTDNAELIPCRLFRGVRLFAERLYEAAHIHRSELLRIRGAEVSGGAPHGSLVALRGVRGERRFGLFPPAVCQRLEGHAALPAGGLRVVGGDLLQQLALRFAVEVFCFAPAESVYVRDALLPAAIGSADHVYSHLWFVTCVKHRLTLFNMKFIKNYVAILLAAAYNEVDRAHHA